MGNNNPSQNLSQKESRSCLLGYVLVLLILVQPIPVRLIGSPALISGLVELYYNEEWRNVCFDYDYGQGDMGDVVCRQLGLGRSGRSYGSRMSVKDPFFLDRVHCTGSENELAQCPSNGLFRDTTDNCSYVLGVTCDDGKRFDRDILDSRCSQLMCVFLLLSFPEMLL